MKDLLEKIKWDISLKKYSVLTTKFEEGRNCGLEIAIQVIETWEEKL
ncbi:MAG: hypothetical protein IKS96_02745 [Fibrobacter sp.]|nr:hypothetical protein [Bacteroidaceae bacterium]MBR6448861.1 hypothetical protein [Fibrobacter sp.]